MHFFCLSCACTAKNINFSRTQKSSFNFFSITTKCCLLQQKFLAPSTSAAAFIKARAHKKQNPNDENFIFKSVIIKNLLPNARTKEITSR
jgi:hypothetical protein